jgi:hypothetical protein
MGLEPRARLTSACTGRPVPGFGSDCCFASERRVSLNPHKRASDVRGVMQPRTSSGREEESHELDLVSPRQEREGTISPGVQEAKVLY